jgi:DNA polymerase III subunit chi
LAKRRRAAAKAVTEIHFHIQLADKLLYGCRLLRKAAYAGTKVWVVGESAALAALDQALWTFSIPGEPPHFVPHCHSSSPQQMRINSRIVLAPDTSASPHHDVLLNWGAGAVPLGFERYSRLIELVGSQGDDRRQARLRWKHYAERGYPITPYEQGPAAQAQQD